MDKGINLLNNSCLEAFTCFGAQEIATETEYWLSTFKNRLPRDALNISRQKDRYIGLEP